MSNDTLAVNLSRIAGNTSYVIADSDRDSLREAARALVANDQNTRSAPASTKGGLRIFLRVVCWVKMHRWEINFGGMEDKYTARLTATCSRCGKVYT